MHPNELLPIAMLVLEVEAVAGVISFIFLVVAQYDQKVRWRLVGIIYGIAFAIGLGLLAASFIPVS